LNTSDGWQAWAMDGTAVGEYSQYVVALGWLPAWGQDSCDSRFDAVDSAQLHLHGVWPEYSATEAAQAGAGWPQYCRLATDAAAALDPAVLDRFNTSDGWQAWAWPYALGPTAVHEWAKHGSCTTLNQSDYFALGEAAMASLGSGEGAAVLMSSLAATDGGDHGEGMPRLGDGFVDLQKLRAAFWRDLANSGEEQEEPDAVHIRCGPNCTLTEVWLGIAAGGASHDQLMFHHPAAFGSRNGSDECAGCERVRVMRRAPCGGLPTRMSFGAGLPWAPVPGAQGRANLLLSLGLPMLVLVAAAMSVLCWWRWRDRRRRSAVLRSAARLLEVWRGDVPANMRLGDEVLELGAVEDAVLRATGGEDGESGSLKMANGSRVRVRERACGEELLVRGDGSELPRAADH
jgi:ribonuclease I